MQDLRLVGLTDDGTRLVLLSPNGTQYALEVDVHLKAAVKGEHPAHVVRAAEPDVEPEGGLRPRDVQARIRAGASVEEVAEQSGQPIEWVDRFAQPVLGERTYIAEMALACAARRTTDSLPLAVVVGERLAERGVDPQDLEWDAWRRPDGRWTVHLEYLAGERIRSASWTYDAAVRQVSPDDDEARWLVDEEPDQVVAFTPRLTAVVDPSRAQGMSATAALQPADEDDDADHATIPIPREEPAKKAPAARTTGKQQELLPDTPPAESPAAKTKRASIPSWDEIVFGSSKRRDD